MRPKSVSLPPKEGELASLHLHCIYTLATVATNPYFSDLHSLYQFQFTGNFNCYIKAVPDEVLLLICSYLQEKELCRMSQTCTRLNTICQDGCLWFVVNGLIFISHLWS